jgi:hypothetical protein
LDVARTHYETALRIFKARNDDNNMLGPHQRVGFALLGLSDSILRAEPERESLARRLLEEALSVFRCVFAEQDNVVTTTANALATLLTTQMR